MTDYSTCCLTQYPTPVLMERAKPIEEVNDDIRVLAERMIDIMIETGPNARSVQIHLKPFTLIGATTRSGLLTAPMRARFGIQ